MSTLDLGISQEELREQVVSRAADRVVDFFVNDDEARRRMMTVVREAIDDVAESVAAEQVEPLVRGQIEFVVMQRTNQWGEPTEKPVSFVEYLVQRAEAYMTEPVDYDGKTKDQSRSSWNHRTTQARIAHMVDKHLHYSIEKAMKAAVENANKVIVAGLEKTVKMKLAEVAESMKVKVEVPR